MLKANHSKSFYGGPNPGKAKFVYKLARLELGRFIRIITGHNNLSFFQNKIGLYNEKACRFCGDGDKTITHFMSVCPRLETYRRDFFLDQIPNNDMTWSVRDLLDFSYSPGINEAFEGIWDDEELPRAYHLHDDSLGLDWLEDDSGDVNNNEASRKERGRCYRS